MSSKEEKAPTLERQKAPKIKPIDLMREIKSLRADLGVAVEAVRALGKEVIDSNNQTQAALTDLAVKMGDLQSAFIRTVSEKQLPTVLSQPAAKSQPTAEQSQFDPADLMQHSWKGRKQGEGNYASGSLEYGWDFKDQFKPETLAALPIDIQGYSFSLNGNIITAQKPRGS